MCVGDTLRRLFRFAGHRHWKSLTRGRGGRGAWRVAGGTAAAVLVALLAIVPAPGAGAAAASSRRLASGQSGVAVLDVTVLVDESGSETPQKVADEKQTVGTIVQTMLNPSSRVTVIGFGGVNNVAPGQDPVDVACQPTIASGAANLDYLANCVGQLHRRSDQQGNDTDYAAALNQAMSYLGPGSTATPPAPAGAIKVILMMTDGAVDVSHDTSQYGPNWQLGEQTAVNQQLAAATSAGVQVWPLGFGGDVGTGVTQPQARQYLNSMAAHGAPAVCDKRHAANQPHATWVDNPSDAISALDELYQDAACLGGVQIQDPLSGGQSRTLTLSIPAIASAAAISVDRVNPAVTVTFTQPGGTQWTDTSAISGANNDSPVEVLHLASITKADVGAWRVKLTAPPGIGSQLVSAAVFWQGAVRAIITATPTVKPGQPIDVKLTVLGPDGPITDPATLKSLLVGVTASGSVLPGPVQVPVQASSAVGPAGAGTYTGTYAAPDQAGTLTITGTAAGYGLYATQLPATVVVGAFNRVFLATPHFSGVTSVQVGHSLSGTVDFINQTGATRRVVLKLTASGAKATISPSTVISVPSTPSGNPPSVPFTVNIAGSSPAGPAGLEVRAVDADTGRRYSNAASDVITVTTPPGFFAKYRWEIAGTAALILLAVLAVLWRRKVIRDRKNVRGLVATLRRGGQQVGKELAAEEKYSEVFPFIIRDEASASPRLDHPPRAESLNLYQVRRGGRGLVRLITPNGLRPYELEVSGPGQVLESGLELSFRDTRHPEWAGSSSSTSMPGYPAGLGEWAGSGAGSPAMPAAAPPGSPPSGYEMPTMPIAKPPPPRDPWLS
jgi:hypothetical protein